jgi:hypothetical protein
MLNHHWRAKAEKAVRCSHAFQHQMVAFPPAGYEFKKTKTPQKNKSSAKTNSLLERDVTTIFRESRGWL